MKIRDLSGIFSQGKTIYINHCSSEAIQHPKDARGNAVSVEAWNIEGIEIPLAVGKVRDSNEKDENGEEVPCLIVDALFHPVILDCARAKASFKKELIKLTIDSVVSETGVQVVDDYWIVCELSYIGGRGDDKSIPVLFPVPTEGDSKGEKTATAGIVLMLDIHNA